MRDADTILSPVAVIPQPRRLERRGGGRALAELALEQRHADDLPPEGYRIDVQEGRAVIEASGPQGFRHARATLREIAAAGDGRVPELRAEDAPVLRHRGIIEGFYGEPWSHEERLAAIELGGRLKLNSYVYAPKDDPWHRERWREPYPDAELARLGELAQAGAAGGVEVVVALHPAGSMVFSDDADHELLAAKAVQLLEAGIPGIALLFDDVPQEPRHEADRERFGEDAAALGVAHAEAIRRFAEKVVRQWRPGSDLLVVPTDYAGNGASPYREAFAAGLPDEALVWWTGRDIVVGDVTRDDIDAAGEVFGDRLLLWDNFPVNDFDRGRAFLGPLVGRTTDVEGSALRGAWSNPMVEFWPGCFGIAAFADWAWNPAAYDPDRAAAVALRIVAGEDAEALAPLVRTLSSWPPSARMDPDLDAAVAAARDGGGDAELRERLEELAGLAPLADGRLEREPVRALRPWLAAAVDMGAAGLAALEFAAGTASRVEVEAALARAEGHDKKVAIDVVPGFVQELLKR